MPEIDEAGKVSFHIIAREWRCKWSSDAGKISLTKAQEVLDKFMSEIKAVPHVEKVQRIVCGGCLDFKVIVSMPAIAFAQWETGGFDPEAAFLKDLGDIDGITAIETQTYTLMEM